MLGTAILGILAGLVAPKLEPQIKNGLERVLLTEMPVSAAEMRLISFVICLLGAAILSVILGNGHAVPLAVGATLGVFGPRLMAKYKQSKAPDYDS